MNTLNIYSYKGASDSDVATSFICLNGHCYVVAYIDVAIYYGPYIGADNAQAVEPKHLPGLSNVAFNAQIYKWNGDHPTSRVATPKLILKQDILDLDDQRICLGTRYTFASKIMEDCTSQYCMVWSTNDIEMPYAADMIYIGGQNGVSDPWSPCD